MTIDNIKFIILYRKGNISGKDMLLGKINVKFNQFNTVVEYRSPIVDYEDKITGYLSFDMNILQTA